MRKRLLWSSRHHPFSTFAGALICNETRDARSPVRWKTVLKEDNFTVELFTQSVYPATIQPGLAEKESVTHA